MQLKVEVIGKAAVLALIASLALIPAPGRAQTPDEQAATAELNRTIAGNNAAADDRYAYQQMLYQQRKKEYDALQQEYQAKLKGYSSREMEYREQKELNDQQQQQYRDRLNGNGQR